MDSVSRQGHAGVACVNRGQQEVNNMHSLWLPPAKKDSCFCCQLAAISSGLSCLFRVGFDGAQCVQLRSFTRFPAYPEGNQPRFTYDTELQWSRGNKFNAQDPLNNAWTDWVYLDPDRVDLIVQNKLRNMDYYELIQEAGDCIFIPYAMLHQVQKLDDGMQVAASWMFLPETIYEEDVCQQAPLKEDLPLAAMDTLFMYTGKGLIPQGYQDPLNFVRKVRSYMQRQGEDYLTLKTFASAVSDGHSILRTLPGRKKKIKDLFKRLTSYLGCTTN